MKSNILRKRIESIARLALVSVLSLVMVFESFALVDAETTVTGNATTYSGYLWTRMYCKNDMDDFFINGKDNNTNKMFLGQVHDASPSSAVDNTEENWFRVLIVYSDDHYYFTGTDMCNDRESYAGTYIKPAYGIDPSMDTFKTLSGMKTPWIKKCGNDSNNDNDCLYYIRCCDGEKLGNSLACVNLNHYGIFHHAAVYSENRWIGTSGLSTYHYRHCYNSSHKCEYKLSCHACVHPEHTFRWNRSFKDSFYEPIKAGKLTLKQARSIYAAYCWNFDSYDGNQHYSTSPYGSSAIYSLLSTDSPKRLKWVTEKCTDPDKYDNSLFANKDFKLSDYTSYCKDYNNGSTNTKKEGTTEIYFDLEGICDRCYYYPDNDYEISVSRFETGSNRGFKIWIGEPQAVSTTTMTKALAPGSVSIFSDHAIGEKTKLVVPQNATMIMRGYCYNDGNIYVDGGTLIIQGTLDTHRSSETLNTEVSGDVARILKVADGTSVTVVPGTIYLTNKATLIIEDQGIIVSSRFADSMVKLTDYSHATVKGSLTARSIVLENSSLRGRNGSVILVGYDPGDLNQGTAYGKSYFTDHKSSFLSSFGSPSNGSLSLTNSSMQQDGLLYATEITSTGSSTDFITHINVEATINDMMRNW